MSKGQRKKITVKTQPGEAVFVASADILSHIAETYDYMASVADTKEEADSWQQVAEEIRYWVERTYHTEGESFDEEW